MSASLKVLQHGDFHCSDAPIHVTIIYKSFNKRMRMIRHVIEHDVVPEAAFGISETWLLWYNDQGIPAYERDIRMGR